MGEGLELSLWKTQGNMSSSQISANWTARFQLFGQTFPETVRGSCWPVAGYQEVNPPSMYLAGILTLIRAAGGVYDFRNFEEVPISLQRLK
jgi:hypothetical protein